MRRFVRWQEVLFVGSACLFGLAVNHLVFHWVVYTEALFQRFAH